jgi:hypothetical protein
VRADRQRGENGEQHHEAISQPQQHLFEDVDRFGIVGE